MFADYKKLLMRPKEADILTITGDQTDQGPLKRDRRWDSI